jgi:hypothetical protein
MGNQAPTNQNHCGSSYNGQGKGKGEQVRNAGDSKGMGRGKNEFSMNQGDMKGKGEGRKGKGKGTPSMGSKDGKGKTKGDAFVNNDDRRGKSKGEPFMDSEDSRSKGKCEARQEQSSAGYVNLRDLQGTFEKNAMGKGERFESYKSFATNAPMAGSFANRMSFQTDVPDDVLGSRESFARGSFAALRSDESFAAGLPSSAARSGQSQLPVAVSFVAGPSGRTTLPPDGRNTQLAPQTSFFMPAGTTTSQSPQGLSTRGPQTNSFIAMSGPARKSPYGNPMEMINELFEAT